ncbi:MAG: hypothetical protein WA813_25560, partial [Beijerinckiaceae bacterium]
IMKCEPVSTFVALADGFHWKHDAATPFDCAVTLVERSIRCKSQMLQREAEQQHRQNIALGVAYRPCRDYSVQDSSPA